MAFLEVVNMYKKYYMGETVIVANNNINFCVEEGELVVIVGASGAGKSTILNILGGMDTPTKGDVIIDGKNISKLNEKELTKYRRYDIGFVFQFYNLIQNLNVRENVELSTQISKKSISVDNILEKVGLKDRMYNFPSQLSGGEQQRVAIARALAKKPKLLLCDEPTGALDYKTGKSILKLLQETSINMGTTVIIITHNKAIAPIANRIIEVSDSKIREIIENKNPVSIDEIEW